MPKNLIQDMIKSKSNSSKVENISEKKKTDIDAKFNSLYNLPKKNSENYTNSSNNGNEKNSGSKYGLWLVALIAMIFLFFAVSFLFSGAKITINPKTVDLTLDDSFAASKDSANADSLPFDLVVISGEETKEVQGGEEKDVNDSSKGIAIVYNTFSATSQKLTANTRLEGSNGKIYKTKTVATIPGMKTDGTPGSVEVEIYGAETGEAYNSGPIDFTVLGFKGTAKYSKIYARSKGDLIGGLKGKIRQISEIDKTNTIGELKETLQKKLLQKASDQIPDGYILFKDAVIVQTDDGKVGSALENGMVPIVLKGTFYGFLFDEKKLTKRIIQSKLEKYQNDDVFIPNIKDFIFTLNNKENISFGDVSEINFNLAGTSKIVWKIDSEKLIGDVLGKNKKEFNQTLIQYPGIDSAELVIKPVWRKTFPDKLKDIEVLVNYPK